MSELLTYWSQILCVAGVFGSGVWLLWARREPVEQSNEPPSSDPATQGTIDPPQIVLPSSSVAPTDVVAKKATTSESGRARACKCCGKPATKARPYSSVPHLDTVEWLNRKEKLNSMPRRWIVRRPHVSTDHPAEFCDPCEVRAVAYLENGHAGFRADNQKHLQTQDRQCEVLNAGMDASLDIAEQETLEAVAKMFPQQRLN
jgi:hypothetical protein